MKNLKQFEDLIKRYESITLENITNKKALGVMLHDDSFHIANKLTGYGLKISCTLCQAVDDNCQDCIWTEKLTKVNSCVRHKTYDDIENAQSPEELLKAFKKRAKYMRKHLAKVTKTL